MTLIHAKNPVYICMCTHIEKYMYSLYDLPRLQITPGRRLSDVAKQMRDGALSPEVLPAQAELQ